MTLFKNKYRVESARLKGWDYRNPGYYFVTICTKNREHYFGYIADGEMHLSVEGEIAASCWREIPCHHTSVELDEFVIMPNHVHGIVLINEYVVAGMSHSRSLQQGTSQRDTQKSAISPKAGSLSVIIRSYKSAVSRLIGLNGSKEFEWQARFYDRIVRDEKAFDKIREYIFNNALKWEVDKNNPSNLYI